MNLPLRKHPLIEKLLSLELPPDDYAIFGSGPLLAHGIRDLSNDLDIIARGSAWQRTCGLGQPVPAPLHGTMVEFFEGTIQIFDSWTPGNWDLDYLIDSADIIEGIRFGRLEHIVREKERLNRPKDIEDIRLIKEYLAGKK